jgi:hypothetical protein
MPHHKRSTFAFLLDQQGRTVTTNGRTFQGDDSCEDDGKGADMAAPPPAFWPGTDHLPSLFEEGCTA